MPRPHEKGFLVFRSRFETEKEPVRAFSLFGTERDSVLLRDEDEVVDRNGGQIWILWA